MGLCGAGPAADLRRPGGGGLRAARRGDGRRRGRRGLADLRRSRLLHGDRGLPGGRPTSAGPPSGPPRCTRGATTQPGLVPFTGQCAVHRGQIMRVHGAFADALEEFDRAVAALPAQAGAPEPPASRWPSAATCSGSAATSPPPRRPTSGPASYGYEPQPGLALLWLARGRSRPRRSPRSAGCWPSRATRCTARSCSRPRSRSCSRRAAATRRAPLADELAGSPTSFGCAALRAMAQYAHGERAARAAARRAPALPRAAPALAAVGAASGARYERGPLPGAGRAGPAGCSATRTRPRIELDGRPRHVFAELGARPRRAGGWTSCWQPAPAGGLTGPRGRGAAAGGARAGATPRSRPRWCSARRPWPGT